MGKLLKEVHEEILAKVRIDKFFPPDKINTLTLSLDSLFKIIFAIYSCSFCSEFLLIPLYASTS